MEKKRRCNWCNENNPLYVHYHDHVWGVPVHDDTKLFEMLVLEGFQAGLSWETILNRQQAFEKAFDGFAIETVAAYDENRINILMHDASIIRNRRKIEAAIHNARTVLQIQKEHGSFDAWLWSFTDGKTLKDCNPVSSPLSDKISKQMKRMGMKYTGTVIIQSFLMAVGMINGHEEQCEWR